MGGNEFAGIIAYRACPLCGSQSFSESHRADCSLYPHFRLPLSPVLTWMRCSTCQLSFRNGFYTDDAFAILFEKAHLSQPVGHDYERQRSVWARVIDKVTAHQSAGVWLDVCFGNGALLLMAVEHGFTPVSYGVSERYRACMEVIAIRR
jgi:hypothetical protein